MINFASYRWAHFEHAAEGIHSDSHSVDVAGESQRFHVVQQSSQKGTAG